MAEELGDRMKDYEKAYDFSLPKKHHVIIRVDGRAFHTLTSNMDKPFDEKFIGAMKYTATSLLDEIQNAKMVYVASDEISVFVTDTEELESQPWFGNRLNKIVSISASEATYAFNTQLDRKGLFDSRAFLIPKEEVPNYFIWRQRDWQRNSLGMFARKFFSARQLHRKGGEAIHEMLGVHGENWASLPFHIRNGTFFIKVEGKVEEVTDKLVYADFKKWLK